MIVPANAAQTVLAPEPLYVPESKCLGIFVFWTKETLIKRRIDLVGKGIAWAIFISDLWEVNDVLSAG
jgi:hypothetical protein